MSSETKSRAGPLESSSSADTGGREAYKRGVSGAIEIIRAYKLPPSSSLVRETANELIETIARDIEAHLESAEAYADCGPARAADPGTTGAEGLYGESASEFEKWWMPYSTNLANEELDMFDIPTMAATITIAKAAWAAATQRAPVTPPQGGPFSESLKKPSRDRVWIVEQNGRVHSVHSTHESAMKERGENLRIGAPWQVLPWATPAPVTTQGRDELREAVELIVQDCIAVVNRLGPIVGEKSEREYGRAEASASIARQLREALAAAKEPR